MKDDAVELIREIAVEHSVALDRDDPILILQTATRRILQDALSQSRQAMTEAMGQHRSELELAASKWHADAKRTASQIVQDVQTASRTAAVRELNEASKVAACALQEALARHERVLALSTWICALSAAVVVLAVAALVWMSARVPERSEPRDRRVACVMSGACIPSGSSRGSACS